MTNYNSVIQEIDSEFPGFEILEKKDSLFMKVINILLIVITFGMMRTFMTHFITTVGTSVYVPTGWDSWDNVSKVLILKHERVHMRQSRKYGSILFRFLYLFMLPSIFTFRSKFEMEAYNESIRCMFEYYGNTAFDEAFKNRMVSYFTSSMYFWMNPCRKSVRTWYDEAVKSAMDEKHKYGTDN